MTSIDPFDALRARIAVLDPAQRETLRLQLEARGIAWERVAPVGESAAQPPSRLPLSPAQQHFWIQQRIHSDSSAYVIAFQWRIEGPLDRQALSRALQHLVDRHAPFRTAFPSEDGQPWQDVQPHCAFVPGFSDPGTACSGVEEQVRRIATAPFDLSRAPLVRAHLFRLGEEEHVLAFGLHHIVADGWSRGIFMRELAAGYRAFAAGDAPDLPALSHSYGDLVLSQRHWLESPEAARQSGYWQARLAGLEPQELPADRPRHSVADMGAATLQHTLPAALTAGIAALSGRCGATPFVVLLAAFKLLMHRYSGQTDLAVCVPVAGRRNPDAANLIGLFTNTLVLRTELEPGLTFPAWVARVQETFADAFENQEYPFVKLVDALGINRDGGQNPLFQISFQVQTQGYRQQNAETVDLGTAALSVRQEAIPLAEAKLDLAWQIMERESGYAISVEYREALFEAERINRMIAHFEHLLKSILSNPDALLPCLDYMPDTERQAVVKLGTARLRPLPQIGVHEAISDVAARHPDAIALECEGRAWTYAELDAAATALARHLATMPEPVRPGARVGVALPGKPHAIIAFLAVLKAGATYVPLDPRHPPDRLAYVLEDAETTLILTSEPSLFPDVRCLDPTLPDHDPPDVALPAGNPSHIAYILYTSGSTGRPKGVPIDHAGLLNQFRSLAREPGIRAGDRMLAVTTPAFDISILEMLWPLSVGATVVLNDQELLFAPAKLAQVLEDDRITHFQATPASWRMLVDSGWPGRAGLTGLIGGEALDAQLALRLIEQIDALWNVYGPTETTIWASALRVKRRHALSGKVPIGGPLDNTHFHVLDAYMQAVPVGVPGELAIGGIGLSPGYWRRPALAAEKFVPDPCFDPESPSLALYRTGDVVIRREGGEMEFVGRTDFQVKLRGYRIEIGEIESLLHEEPGVDQAIVVLDKENERLIAYILLKDRSGHADKEAMRRELRRSLAARLPRYMVPTAFVLMEQFALNPNGKVDRKRLPSPEAPVGETTSRPARTGTETTLLAVWKEVLRRDDIGVEDNFFDLGGDSVVGMQIVARSQARGLQLAPTQIFEHQTVAAQALVARPATSADGAATTVWQRYAAALAPDPWLVLLPWPWSAGIAGRAVDAVADHHPALRGRLKQQPEAMPDDETALKDRARSLAASAEDFAWQAGIVHRDGAQQLALALHPLLIDGRSLPWLAEDLRDAATRLASGSEPALPPTGHYGDWLDSGVSAARSRPLPVLRNVAAEDRNLATELETRLGSRAAGELKIAARHLDTTVERLVLAAMADALAQWNGSTAVDIDLLTCERPDLARQRTIGNFTRLVPVSARRREAPMPGGPAMALDVAGGQGLVPDADGKADVAFSWTGPPGGSGLQYLSMPATDLPPGYPLSLGASLSETGLRLVWRFDPAKTDHAAVASLADMHLAALASIKGDSNSPAARVDSLLSRLRQRGA